MAQGTAPEAHDPSAAHRALPERSHVPARLTMGLVLGFWLAVTIGAPVVAPWLAVRVERAEVWLGFDRNESEEAPESEP